MKYFLSILSCLCLSLAASAQNKNLNTSVQLNTTGIIVKGAGKGIEQLKTPVSQLGISVNRRIMDNISVQVSYQQWIQDLLYPDGWSGVNEVHYELPVSQASIGKPASRYNYRFVDASAIYNLYKGHHTVYGAAGASFATGQSRKVTGITQEILIPFEGEWTTRDILSNSELDNQLHFGGNILVGYNYGLFKDRINIGVSGKARILSGHFTQYDASINIGYHFNCL